MKHLIKKIVLIFLFMNLALTIQMAVANAAPAEVPPTSDYTIQPIDIIKEIGKETGLPDYNATGQHPDSAGALEEGASTVVSPVYFAIDMFRYVISTLAFIVIIIMAIKLISTSNEEEAGKAKKSLIIGTIGLLIVQLADVIVKKMFFGEQGEAFEDIATAKLYAEESVSQIRGIIGFVEAFIGVVAVLVIIIRGFTLVAGGGEEEQLTKAKKHVVYAIIGLVVIGLSEVVVRGFIFPEAGQELPKLQVGKKIIVSLTNYLSGFIAIISFAMLFYSGYKFVTAGGEDEAKEKVRKMFIGAIIALVLSLGAFAAVNTLITLDNTQGPGAENKPEP